MVKHVASVLDEPAARLSFLGHDYKNPRRSVSASIEGLAKRA